MLLITRDRFESRGLVPDLNRLTNLCPRNPRLPHQLEGDPGRARALRIRDCREIVLGAVKEVAGPTFFSLLVIAVAFLPVLMLQAQEGRMFKPLAYTKTLTMIVAAVLAITLDPALRMLLTRVERFHFRPAWLCRIANAVLTGDVKSEDRGRADPARRSPRLHWSL